MAHAERRPRFPEPVTRVRGRRCNHTFIKVGGTAIRTARPVTPDTDPETGREIIADCPMPRCERVTVVPRTF